MAEEKRPIDALVNKFGAWQLSVVSYGNPLAYYVFSERLANGLGDEIVALGAADIEAFTFNQNHIKRLQDHMQGFFEQCDKDNLDQEQILTAVRTILVLNFSFKDPLSEKLAHISAEALLQMIETKWTPPTEVNLHYEINCQYNFDCQDVNALMRALSVNAKTVMKACFRDGFIKMVLKQSILSTEQGVDILSGLLALKVSDYFIPLIQEMDAMTLDEKPRFDQALSTGISRLVNNIVRQFGLDPIDASIWGNVSVSDILPKLQALPYPEDATPILYCQSKYQIVLMTTILQSFSSKLLQQSVVTLDNAQESIAVTRASASLSEDLSYPLKSIDALCSAYMQCGLFKLPSHVVVALSGSASNTLGCDR